MWMNNIMILLMGWLNDDGILAGVDHNYSFPKQVSTNIIWWSIDKLFNILKYDKQDQQQKATFNERSPHLCHKSQWQRAQADPKQKRDRVQGKPLHKNK
jgi:hypothetical protein